MACGVWPGRTAEAMLTTPRSVSRPGTGSRPAVVSKSTSLTVTSSLRGRSGPAGALDLVRRVAKRAEDPVVEPGPARLHEEVRAHVLPHHLAIGCDLEDPSVAPLADERVAVGQALSARDVRAEEIEERLVVVLPHDLAGARIDLDHPRVGRGMIPAMRAVVEDEEVAVGQRPGIVLLGQGRAAELPDDRAGDAIDDDDGRDVPEADHQVTVGQLGHRVGVRPLLAVVLSRDDLGVEVQVLPAPPLPDGLAAGRDLDQVVGVHGAVDLGAGQAAPDPRAQRRRQRAQAQQDDVAVAQLARIVVMVRVANLPHDLAVPVDLEGGARLEPLPGHEALHAVFDLARVEEVTVVEQVAVGAGPMRQRPGVRDRPVHVDQVDGPVAEHRRKQGKARQRARRVVRDQAGARPPHPLLIHGRRGSHRLRYCSGACGGVKVCCKV